MPKCIECGEDTATKRYVLGSGPRCSPCHIREKKRKGLVVLKYEEELLEKLSPLRQ